MYRVFISVTLILSVFSSMVAAKIPFTESYEVVDSGVSPPEGITTSADYESYLMELSKTEPQALKVKEQFSKISVEEKKRFMHYITNPSIMLEVLNTPVDKNSKKELYNGDIVLTRKTTTEISDVNEYYPEEDGIISKATSLFISSAFAAPTKMYTMKVTDVKEITFPGGIPQCTYTAWVVYKSKDKRTVTSVDAGNGSVVNWYPVLQITKDSVEKYVYGNKAIAEVVWRISCPISPFNGPSFNQHHHVLGFANGESTYRFYK